jgi:hypothetical protein
LIVLLRILRNLGSVVVWVTVLICGAKCAAEMAGPTIFYTDIESGPRTGGEGGQDGAFVCLYGERFGNTRGSSLISLGGAQASDYKLWTDPGQPYRPGHYAKACAQISHMTPEGKVSVELTTSTGKSNSLTFTVRPGKVYFVAPKGGDVLGDGSGDHPWQTVKHCKSHMAPGDICYVREGTKLAANENYGAAIVLDSSGEPGKPKALLAYPGATVVVDNKATVGAIRALTNYDRTSNVSEWTIAGFIFDSVHSGVQIARGKDIRLVDNDIRCSGPYCYGFDGGLLIGGPGVSLSGISVLGNRIHNVGCHDDMDYHASKNPCQWIPAVRTAISTSGSTWKITLWPGNIGPGFVIEAGGELRRIQSCDPGCRSGRLDAPFSKDLPEGTSWKYRFPSPPKFFHSVYFGDTNSIEFAWNEIDGKEGQACRGLLFHSTAGHDMYDVHVHDNDIHDTVCDCVAFGTVDPNQGVVEAYNNTLYRCGTGSTTVQQSSFSGVYLSNDADCLPNPSRGGKVEVYNNTVYNAGSGGETGNNNSCFALKAFTIPQHGSASLELTNNACVQVGDNRQTYYNATGEDAVTHRPLSSFLSGSHNDCSGAGGKCPAELTDSLEVPGGFVSPNTGNFRLQLDSKLTGQGKASRARTDQDGMKRDHPNVGAF